MEFSWSEEDQAFRDRLRGVIEGALPPKWQDMIPGEEATSAFTVEFYEMLAAQGLLTRTGRPSTAGGTHRGGSSSSWVRSCGAPASRADPST